MSSREKNLLIFLAVAVFVVVHLAAAKMYFIPQLKEARLEAKRLNERAEQGGFMLDAQDEMIEEMDWLAQYEPAPIVAQTAESQLMDLADRQASSLGLEVKNRKILPAIQADTLTYHRARAEFQLSGREQAFYQWLTFLHSPPDFRAVTSLSMGPHRDDPTLVECRVTLEQWFVPETDTEFQ